MATESKTEPVSTGGYDPFQSYARWAGLGLRMLGDNVRQAANGGPQAEDPLGLNEAMAEWQARLFEDPTRLIHAQMDFCLDQLRVQQRLAQRLMGLTPEPVAEADSDDRRFKDPAWRENAAFDALKESFLLATRAAVDLIGGTEGLSPKARARLEFATRQTLDAFAPTNFAATNPQVLRAILESGGTNLISGLDNLLTDMERTRGRLDVTTNDLDAFEVGRNLAVTPGKVVYQNDLMQLIQYAPTTPEVNRRPLLIIPPWMNKYYIMDLRPGNSMVQWLLDQGHTVFMISWVNPDERLADKSFENYMLEGPLAAIDAIEAATGEREVNAVGYCLGGIVLAAVIAWAEARGENRIASASYLTTMVDFADVGEVGLFIDEELLGPLEERIRAQGFLDGKTVADTFSVLRANDLVWSFYVDSYLMGNQPRAFDLLYWNADSTNMPAAMHTYFMRNMYLDNRLREPGGITLDGTPIDVGKVTTPAFVLATREDHIAPWRTAYETTQLFSGPVQFVLGASGHIAGVVNPPHREKYAYWTNPDAPASADAWLEGAEQHKGSWWPDWMRWLAPHAGDKVTARPPGAGGLEAIEDAPGSYVKDRLDQR